MKAFNAASSSVSPKFGINNSPQKYVLSIKFAIVFVLKKREGIKTPSLFY
jgi:hypothetical protein